MVKKSLNPKVKMSKFRWIERIGGPCEGHLSVQVRNCDRDKAEDFM